MFIKECFYELDVLQEGLSHMIRRSCLVLLSHCWMSVYYEEVDVAGDVMKGLIPLCVALGIDNRDVYYLCFNEGEIVHKDCKKVHGKISNSIILLLLQNSSRTQRRSVCGTDHYHC